VSLRTSAPGEKRGGGSGLTPIKSFAHIFGKILTTEALWAPGCDPYCGATNKNLKNFVREAKGAQRKNQGGWANEPGWLVW